MAGRDPRTGRFPKGNGAGRGGEAKGEGLGEGWGGPATGCSRPDLTAEVQRMSNDADARARADLRREKVLAMYEHYVNDTAAHPMVRIAAGDKLLDRIEGKPIARNVHASVSDPSQLSDADLAAIAAGGRPSPSTPEGDSPEPGTLVH